MGGIVVIGLMLIVGGAIGMSRDVSDRAYRWSLTSLAVGLVAVVASLGIMVLRG